MESTLNEGGGICSVRSSRKSSTTNIDDTVPEEVDRDLNPRHTWLTVNSENNYRNGVLMGNWFENAADIRIRRVDKRLPSDVSADLFNLSR